MNVHNEIHESKCKEQIINMLKTIKQECELTADCDICKIADICFGIDSMIPKDWRI